MAHDFDDFDFDFDSESSSDTLRCPFCLHKWDPDLDEQVSCNLFEEGEQEVTCPSCREGFPVNVTYTKIVWESPSPVESARDSNDEDSHE